MFGIRQNSPITMNRLLTPSHITLTSQKNLITHPFHMET